MQRGMCDCFNNISYVNRWRQKMDELKEDALASYVQSLIASFTSTQMKKILFIGLNTIKNEVEYEKLVSLNLSINKIIDKQSKNEQKEEEFTPHISIILKVEKNASLSETIPSDIIGKNICQYLIMRNITKLAQCDRKLAIICHSPIAIKNLRHRLDPYNPYGPEAEGVLIDGGYDWNNTLNRRRISSVEQLSVPLKILNDLPRLNSFQRVKDLTFYDHNIEFSDWSDSYTQLIPMPLLQTIAFINTYNFTNILSFLQEYRETEIIYQLQSIAFTGCSFDQLQDYQFYEEDCKTDERVAFMFEKYKNLFEFILPSQPNNLQMIKFQNSYWTKTDADECKAANDSFVDLERIKASLANLRAFVYSGMAYNAFSKNNKENAFYYLTESVLSNITSFKQLESVHVHSPDYQLVPVFLNKQSKVALAKIREVCMSISLNDPSSGRVAHQIHTLVPNLEKLCLVIRIENMLHETIVIFHQMMHSILCCNKNLKLLQIVCLMKTNCSENENTPYCIEKIQIMNKMGKQLAQTLQSIKVLSYFSVDISFCM